MQSACLVASLAFAPGCSDGPRRAPEAPPRLAPSPPEPQVAPPPAAPTVPVAQATSALGPFPSEPRLAALAGDGAETFVVAVDDDTVHRALRLPDGRFAARDALSRAGFDALPWLVACDGGCVLFGRGAGAYVALRLDGSGTTVRVPADEPTRGIRRVVTRGTLVLLVADPALRVLELPLAGPATARVRVLDDAQDGRLREPLGLAPAPSGFVGLYRRGVPEDAASEVVLVTARTQRALEPLHDLAKLERLRATEAGVEVVSAFEFGRPIRFEFTEAGGLRRFAELPPAAPSAEVARVELETDGDALVAVGRAASGDVVRRTRIPRAAGTSPAAVTRTSRGFSVVFTDRIADAWWVRVADLEGAVESP